MTIDKYLTHTRLLVMLISIMLLTLIITKSNAYAALYGSDPDGNVAGEAIIFRWYDTTHAPSYTLQIALDAAFTNMYHEEASAPSSGFISIAWFYDDGRTYYWRVIRNDTNATSATLSFVNGPSAAPGTPEMGEPSADTSLGGKNGFFIWMSPSRAYNYKVTAATDSFFFNKVYTKTTENFYVYTDTIDKLPGDGSKIYWKVQAWNSKGESDSPTYSFINDCNMASIGSSVGLSHIDTCSDDYTFYKISDYLLKDISRRGTNRMQPKAAIITGLNSDNVNRLKEEQIVPLQDSDNNWETANQGDLLHEMVNPTAQQDAIHAQVYTGKFYDYLLSTFRKRATDSNYLNSFDGNGSSMYNLIKGVDCGSAGKTVAYWLPATWNVHYCLDGASNWPELVGHEWGHAVSGTASTRNAGLDYYGESGALEEAFADWMGLAFKHSVFNDNSWLFFGSETVFSDPERKENFADIERLPNYYNGNGYQFNASVWKNSRLPSTMFYLLANGGVHPYSQIRVQGINSIATAMQIAFRANMEKWESGVNFLQASKDMSEVVSANFSNPPNDYPNILYQLKNAWAAVGVCDPPPTNPPAGYINACGLPKIIFNADESKGTVNSSVKVSTISGKQYEPVWGQSVTVVATPQLGYVFVNWTENGSLVTVQNGSSAQPAPQSYTFTADSDRTLTANFAPIGVIDFGNVNVNNSSSPVTIPVNNNVSPIVTFGQAQITGTDTTDFAIVSDSCSNRPLALYTLFEFPLDQRECSIQVTFTPHSVGVREAALSISATAGGQTVLTTSYPLTGNGVITSIAVSSSSTPGGTVSLSGSQLWGGTATATATPNTGYAFTGWLEDGYIVSSSASYSFTVTASRDLLAMFSSTPAAIAATPSSGYFGATTTGTASPERTFTITNSGLQPLTISAISLSGINLAEFGVTYHDCVQDLSPGASCSIRVNFTPAAPGAKTARLNIASNAPATPSYVIDLSGYGGTPAMLYTGGFSANFYSSAQNAYNSSYDGTEIRLWAADFNESLNCNRPVTAVIKGGYNGNFADRIGKSALQGTLTISSGTVVIDGLQIGGTSYQSVLSTIVNTPGSGTVTSSPAAINCPGNCTTTLVNGDQITLTAAPVGDATFTGWSGGGCIGTGNCTVTMTGDTTITALFSAAKIAVAPSSESLGSVFAGTASPPQTITVTSSGTQDLIIGTLALSGTNPTEFVITEDLCSGQTLAPLAICTVLVSFNPASTGAKTASLTIPSNDPQTAVFSVSLNGIGALPTIFVTRAGDGLGTVTSSPAGINCGSSCTAAFAINTAVTLSATPDFGYTFAGWSGACSDTGGCALTMSADYSVTATFIETPIASCSANPAKVNESYYPTIQAAYNAAPDNSTIKLLAMDIYESFVADRAITVTLDGGYKCSFTSTQTETIIHSSPHLVDGIVNMMNIRVSQ